MVFEYSAAKKETGVDVTLQLPGDGEEVPVTSVSFTEEANTSEVQFSTSYNQDIAVTGVTYSGSFETAGRDNDLRDRLWGEDTPGQGNTSMPRYLSSMTIVDGGGRAYIFTNVLVTSHGKDSPADDRTTESYDFSAERLNIQE